MIKVEFWNRSFLYLPGGEKYELKANIYTQWTDFTVHRGRSWISGHDAFELEMCIEEINYFFIKSESR